jgi:tetratricopeptide (TPR) repeat protein
MRRRKAARAAWAALLAGSLLSGCAAFPQMVRHPDPLTPAQHVQLGASYEAEGLRDDARRQYDAALRGPEKSVPALIARGNLAFNEGDLKAAERHYRRALRLEPGHAGANNNLAMVLLTRGRKKDLERAEGFAKRALDGGGPLKPYVLETLASIYIAEGRVPEARRSLEEAVSSAPPGNEELRRQLERTRQRLAISR